MCRRCRCQVVATVRHGRVKNRRVLLLLGHGHAQRVHLSVFAPTLACQVVEAERVHAQRVPHLGVLWLVHHSLRPLLQLEVSHQRLVVTVASLVGHLSRRFVRIAICLARVGDALEKGGGLGGRAL